MVKAWKKTWFLHSDLPSYSTTMAAAQGTPNAPPALILQAFCFLPAQLLKKAFRILRTVKRKRH